MYFEANRGQTDPRVKFVSRGAGYSVILTQTEVVSGNATNPRRASDSHHRQERRCHAGGAAAAADPLLEPPGVCSGARGLRVGPGAK